MPAFSIPAYIIIFLYGVIIGSFLNVCIYRIPKKENIVTNSSHCMECGYGLGWYDLIPIFSYLFLKGRCRKCKSKLSIQYPMVELLNGVLYLFVFYTMGFQWMSILYCVFTSLLLVLSIIDVRTFEIPPVLTGFITLLGGVQILQDIHHWYNYLLGGIAVSGFLTLLFYITKGRGIGGGDVKLMAAAGLVLGWEKILLAFFLGCIMGSMIHLIRMKISGLSHVLAMGPYLSIGIWISLLYGNRMMEWYVTSMGL